MPRNGVNINYCDEVKTAVQTFLTFKEGERRIKPSDEIRNVQGESI